MTIPTLYSDIIRTIIIMSISGGIVAALFLLIKPLIRHRLPKTAQYYFWLVVLFALLVPVSQILTLPEQAPAIAPLQVASVVERNFVSVNEEPERLIFPPETNHMPPGSTTVNQIHRPDVGTFEITPGESVAVTQLPPSPMALAFTMFLLLYPIGVVLVLAYNLFGYFYFTAKLRRNTFAPYEDEIAMLKHLTKGRRTPRLLCSKLASTPMLIGFFKPTIILPAREYTETQLHGILLHELTHMRRHDIFIKWMTLLACGVHWFNPIVWLAKGGINRDCELSCDEAVILNMDTSGKQSYGNTLINVATDTKIPMPVLSTTMCQEKRALKERLRAIMKSKKHTKLAVLVSMFIMLLGALGACTLGAARNGSSYDYPEHENNEVREPISSPGTTQLMTGGNDLPTPPVSPATRMDFAEIHIYETASTFLGGSHGTVSHVRVTDSRIENFEHILDFEHPSLERTIELWRLDFGLHIDYEVFFSWGTFLPAEDGWLSNASGFSDGVVFFMFSQDNDVITLETKAPWSWFGFVEGIPALTEATRVHLQWNNILPPVDFPGDLSFVYIWMEHGDGGSGHFARYLLSRPIRQGDGGVWMVERVEHLHNVPTTPVPTNTENRAEILERLAAAQEILDSGGSIENWWDFTDPLGAVEAYLRSRPWEQNFIPVHVFPLLPEGTINPFEIPRSHGPEVTIYSDEERSRLETQYPRLFNIMWSPEDCILAPLREQKIAELGGLAFNEAYYFRTDDGRYALITGWRPLISREEFIEATGSDIPQQIGEFTLVGVTVNDTLFDNIIVYNNPISPQIVHQFFGPTHLESSINGPSQEPLVLGEIFVRDVLLWHFYGVYVNENGDYIFMGVTEGFGDVRNLPNLLGGIPSRIVNTTSGEVGIIGSDDRYAIAYYVNPERRTAIEIGFANPDMLPLQYWNMVTTRNFSGVIPASGDILIDVVNLFNPRALLEEYGWQPFFGE